MLRKVKTPDACFCLRRLERRRGIARAQRRREHKKQNAQPLQSDEAQKGLEQGGHVSEFSCFLRAAKKKTLQLRAAFSPSSPNAKDDQLIAELPVKQAALGAFQYHFAYRPVEVFSFVGCSERRDIEQELDEIDELAHK